MSRNYLQSWEFRQQVERDFERDDRAAEEAERRAARSGPEPAEPQSGSARQLGTPKSVLRDSAGKED